MRVPLRWLEEFVDLPTTDPDELAEALNMLGHEVESVEKLEVEWTDVVVGRVVEIAAHPDADKVRVCQVDTGDGPGQIICGAWNFEEGALVPVARPGASLPGGVEIGRREIRGVESNGMICSEMELGLGEDHAGIMVLEGDPAPGTTFSDLVELPDVVFDLSITPNRGDAMSILGIARDLAARFGVTHRLPDIDMPTIDGSTSVEVSILDPDGCRRFTAREIKDVRIGRSPLWLRHRLAKAGIRSISNVVDVTNYVMVELGHPLHAFDARTIAGDTLIVKRAEMGETLVTLDGVTRELGGSDLIIYDADGPTSMAGTMGGERSEVSTSSSDILMEAAIWDPPTIMYMSRRHDLRSEASTRFERGVDPALSETANKRASELVARLTGGKVLAGAIDQVATPHAETRLELRVSEVTRLLGAEMDTQTVSRALDRLGMTVSGDDPISVVVPSYRLDVTRPVDLVEEVARIHGFDKFPSHLSLGAAGGLTPGQHRERALYSTLARAGLSQAVTLPFVGEADLAALGLERDVEHLVKVINPLRDEEARLRPTMLPNLLGSLRFNVSHGNDSVALFESGSVFHDEPDLLDERLPRQTQRIAWAVIGGFGPAKIGAARATADAYLSFALVRLIGEVLGCDLEIDQTEVPGYHPGRSASVRIGDEIIGTAGELSPAAGRHFDLSGRVAIAELDLAPLLAVPEVVLAKPPSAYPSIDFDLSLVVPDTLPVGELIEALATAGGDLLESCRVFDDFRHESLAAGTHAVAVHCRLRAGDRTLTNEDMAPVRASMIRGVEELGARLRGARD